MAVMVQAVIYVNWCEMLALEVYIHTLPLVY